MIPPPASGLSVDSDAGAPPSAPPGIVNAGGFFLDMISLKKILQFDIDQQVSSRFLSTYSHTLTLYGCAKRKEK